MKKVLAAAALLGSLFGADIAPPANLQKMRIPHQEKKTSQFLFSGDFLYWIPELEGLSFAKQSFLVEKKDFNAETKQTQTTQSQDSRSLEIKGNWEPGIRISMGYLFDEKGWDTILNWTFFNNDPSSSATSDADHRLSPTALPKEGFFTTYVDSARGKWYLSQNVADIEVGRNFPVGEFFHARPFFGVRGAKIKNKEILQYSVKILDISQSAQISNKSCYWGSGPRLGGSVAYEFGAGIGVFALGSASVLLGSLDSSAVKVKGIHTVSAMQIQMGCQWERTFRGKYHFGLQTAWEQNFFSGVNAPLPQAREKSAFVENNDLAIKGLTASCHLNF